MAESPPEQPEDESHLVGLGLRVKGLGFRVQDLAFGVEGLGLRVAGQGLEVKDLGSRSSRICSTGFAQGAEYPSTKEHLP